MRKRISERAGLGSTNKMARLATAVASVAGLGTLFSRVVSAATFTWDANSGTTNAQDGGGSWNPAQAAPTNWWNGANTAVPTSTDSAVFGAGSGGAGTVTLAAPLTIGTVTFNAAGSGNYLISGNAASSLTVGSGISLNSSATVNGPLSLSGTYARSTGAVFNYNTGGGNIATSLTGSSSDIIDGLLVGAVASTNGFDFIRAIGTAGQQPTYTNDTWSPGTLSNITTSNASPFTGSTGAVRFTGPAALTLGSGLNVVETGMITNTGGAYTGNITGGNLTSGNGKDLIFLGGDSAYATIVNSRIVDNGGAPIAVTIDQARALTLNGNNSYSGGTYLVGSAVIGSGAALGTGTLFANGGGLSASTAVNLPNNIALNQSLQISGTGNITLSGNISGTNGISLTGSATTTLSGNNSLSGSIAINNGTILAVASANAIGNATLNLQAGGTIISADGTARSIVLSGLASGTSNGGDLLGTPGTGDLTVTLPTLGAATYQFGVNNTNTIFGNSPGLGASTLNKTGAGTLVFAGSGDINFSGGVNILSGNIQMGNGGSQGSVNQSSSGTITGNASSNLIFNRTDTALAVSTNIGGAIGVIQKGSGQTTISGNNTFSGVTSIQNGTLAFASAAAISPNSSLSVAGGTASLGAASPSVPGVQIAAGNLIGTGTVSSASTIDGQSGTVSAKLGGNVGLNKTTSGTLVLSNVNSYAGPTAIQGGTIQLNNGSVFPTLSSSAAIHLDATTLGQGNGTLVTSWANTGTAGGNFTNSQVVNGTTIAVTAPKYTTAAINGQNAISFSSANGTSGQALLLGNSTYTNTSSTLTVYAIVSTPSLTNGLRQGVVSLVGNNGAADDANVTNVSAINASLNNNNWQTRRNGTAPQTSTVTTITGTPYLVSTLFTGATDTVNAWSNVSGNLSSTTSGATATTGNFNIDAAAIGARFSSNTALSTNQFWNGYIGEVLVFNSALSTSDQAALQSYLDAKWLGIGSFVNGQLPTATALQIGSSSGTPTLDLNGVSQQVASLSDAGFSNGVITNSLSASTSVLNVAPASGSTTYGGTIQNGSGVVSLTKSGSGTQILSSASSYSGGTNIMAGTLRANNGITGSATGTGLVSVSSGATLGGNGTLSGAVNLSANSTLGAGGTIAAGAGGNATLASNIGVLSTGGETWNGGANYSWKLNTAGTAGASAIANAGAGTKWDELSMPSLNVLAGSSSTGASAAKFTVQLQGAITGTSVVYNWIIGQIGTGGASINGGPIVTASTELLNGASAAFALDTSQFTVNGGAQTTRTSI